MTGRPASIVYAASSCSSLAGRVRPSARICARLRFNSSSSSVKTCTVEIIAPATYCLESNTFTTHDANKDSDLTRSSLASGRLRFGAITTWQAHVLQKHTCLLDQIGNQRLHDPAKKGSRRMLLQALLELQNAAHHIMCREAKQRRH